MWCGAEFSKASGPLLLSVYFAPEYEIWGSDGGSLIDLTVNSERYLLWHLCQKLLPTSRCAEQKDTERSSKPGGDSAVLVCHPSFNGLFHHGKKAGVHSGVSFSHAVSGKQSVTWEWWCFAWCADRLPHSSLWKRAEGQQDPLEMIWEALAMQHQENVNNQVPGAPKWG